MYEVAKLIRITQTQAITTTVSDKSDVGTKLAPDRDVVGHTEWPGERDDTLGTDLGTDIEVDEQLAVNQV